MFKRLDIRLTGPICNCKNYNLVLIFQIDVDAKIQLAMKCKTCHEIMPIAREEISENTIVSFDVPYDGSVLKRKKPISKADLISKEDKRFLKSLRIAAIEIDGKNTRAD